MHASSRCCAFLPHCCPSLAIVHLAPRKFSNRTAVSIRCRTERRSRRSNSPCPPTARGGGDRIGGRPAGRRTGRACAPAWIARRAPGHLWPCEQDGRQPTNRPESSTPLTMLSPLVAATNTTGSIRSSNSKNSSLNPPLRWFTRELTTCNYML
jgi:hypothetical protein